MGSYHPYPSFHFSVKMVNPMEIASALAGSVGLTTDVDGSFQEVGGLTATMDMETIREGGENRHEIHLPKGVKYENLTVKRGLIGAASSLGTWVESVMNNDLMSNVLPPAINLPSHMLVMLLSKEGWPLMVWNIVNAIPVKWSVTGFNAMKSEYIVEEIEFSYQRFMRFNLDNMLGDLARAAAERVANSPIVKEPLNLAKTAVEGSKEVVMTAGEGAINEAADAVDDSLGKTVENTVGEVNKSLEKTFEDTNKKIEDSFKEGDEDTESKEEEQDAEDTEPQQDEQEKQVGNELNPDDGDQEGESDTENDETSD